MTEFSDIFIAHLLLITEKDSYLSSFNIKYTPNIKST